MENNIKNYDLDRKKIYKTFKECLLKYIPALKSETYGIEKINFNDIIDIELILDLILEDERKGIRLLPYIDFENTNFTNQNITHIDFSNTNARPNPQTVKNKDYSYTILNGMDCTDMNFDGAHFCCTNFKGAKNISIDPQKIAHKSLYGCICYGIDFEGKSFKGVSLIKTNLIGARNVKINKNEIWNRNLNETLLDEFAQIIDEDKQEIEIADLKDKILTKIIKSVPKCI